MARAEKVYGTETVSSIIGIAARNHGYTGTHNQFRVICKATSIDKANAAVRDEGFPYDIFNRSYTMITGNEREIKLCEDSPVWVLINGVTITSNAKYLSMREIMKEYILTITEKTKGENEK